MKFHKRTLPSRADLMRIHSLELKPEDLSAQELFLSLLALSDKTRHVIYEKREEKYGLSEGNINLLMALYLNGKMPLVELSKAMGVKKSTASVMIKRMLSRNIVLFEILPNRDDARVKQLSLTKAGTEFIKTELLPALYQDISRFFSPLTSSEQEQLISLIKKIFNQPKPTYCKKNSESKLRKDPQE